MTDKEKQHKLSQYKEILKKSRHKPREKKTKRKRQTRYVPPGEIFAERVPKTKRPSERIRKQGPREIGRKRKSSFQPAKFERKPAKPKNPLPRIRERKLGPRDIGRKNSYEVANYQLRKPSIEAFKPRLLFRPRSLDGIAEHRRERKKGPREIGRFSRRSYSPTSPPSYDVNKRTKETPHRRNSSNPEYSRPGNCRDSDAVESDSDFSESYESEHRGTFSDLESYCSEDDLVFLEGKRILQEFEEFEEQESPPRKDFKAYIDPLDGRKKQKKATMRMALDNVDFSESESEPAPARKRTGRRVRFALPD